MVHYVVFIDFPGDFLLPSGRSASASPVGQLSGFSSLISDKCYLIIGGANCQCFFRFLFISDNSHNSIVLIAFSAVSDALFQNSKRIPEYVF